MGEAPSPARPGPRAPAGAAAPWPDAASSRCRRLGYVPPTPQAASWSKPPPPGVFSARPAPTRSDLPSPPRRFSSCCRHGLLHQAPPRPRLLHGSPRSPAAPLRHHPAVASGSLYRPAWPKANAVATAMRPPPCRRLCLGCSSARPGFLSAASTRLLHHGRLQWLGPARPAAAGPRLPLMRSYGLVCSS